MTEKERTWPYAVVADGSGFNIRHLAGHLVRRDPYPTRQQAAALRDLLNEAFDLGADP